MPKRKKDKKIPLLESSFEKVLVCKKNNAKSRVEIFIQKPENITKQNLGILAGILEIDNESEDSAYIVNYLVSVIKKEYFSREKRGPIESFEAALHKANLALAKIAEHGNTTWLGKINAIVAIVEKNNIHISQTGKVKTLLLRKNILTDITEGNQETEKLSPLKTFVDVLSGRLEKDDKIIMTSEDIFDIFSIDEIKKSALKFSHSAFVRFLKTALINELEKASVLLLKIKEKELPKEAPQKQKKDESINAFSQTSFSKYLEKEKKKEEKKEEITSGEKKEIINEIKEDLKKESGDFVDKKTGHIYIKEDNFLKKDDSFLEKITENLKSTFDFVKNKINLKNLKESLKNFKLKKAEVNIEKIEVVDRKNNQPEKRNSENIKIIHNYLKNASEKTIRVSSKTKTVIKNISTKGFSKIKTSSKIVAEKISFHGKNSLEKARYHGASLIEYISEKTKKNSQKKEDPSFPEKEVGYSNDEMSLLTKKDALIVNETHQEKIKKEIKTTPFIKNEARKISFSFLPKFSRIKNIFSSLDRSHKIYALLALVAIFVIPYFLANFEKETKNEVTPTKTTSVETPLQNDKYVTQISNLSEINLENEIIKIINLNDKIFAISKNEIIDAENNQKYQIPNDFSEITSVSEMDDLNLIFISDGNNKILSWSPVSKKFGENKINLPNKAEISFQGTYLTYLYIFDKINSQIYRYPRKETTGGFGEGKNWLKEDINLQEVSDITIGENIFLVMNNKINPFFQGKKQPFEIEKTATPISVDKIHTKRDSQYLYTLDRKNSRIVKLDLAGKIISQFYNPEISISSNFNVSEKLNTIYFSIGNKLLYFTI